MHNEDDAIMDYVTSDRSSFWESAESDTDAESAYGYGDGDGVRYVNEYGESF